MKKAGKLRPKAPKVGGDLTTTASPTLGALAGVFRIFPHPIFPQPAFTKLKSHYFDMVSSVDKIYT